MNQRFLKATAKDVVRKSFKLAFRLSNTNGVRQVVLLTVGIRTIFVLPYNSIVPQKIGKSRIFLIHAPIEALSNKRFTRF